MKKSLIFDFDGTLCKSFALIDRTFKETLNDFKKEGLTSEKVKAAFGPSEEGIFLKLLGEDVYKDAFSEYLTLYLKYHDELLSDFIPGIREILEGIDREKYDVYLLTGRSKESLFISLTKLDGIKYFKDFYVGGLYGAIKDETILKLLNDHHIAKEDALYIGDSLMDVIQCNKIGVKIVSVVYDNFESDKRIFDLNPNRIAKNPAELKYFIENEW